MARHSRVFAQSAQHAGLGRCLIRDSKLPTMVSFARRTRAASTSKRWAPKLSVARLRDCEAFPGGDESDPVRLPVIIIGDAVRQRAPVRGGRSLAGASTRRCA